MRRELLLPSEQLISNWRRLAQCIMTAAPLETPAAHLKQRLSGVHVSPEAQLPCSFLPDQQLVASHHLHLHGTSCGVPQFGIHLLCASSMNCPGGLAGDKFIASQKQLRRHLQRSSMWHFTPDTVSHPVAPDQGMLHRRL